MAHIERTHPDYLKYSSLAEEEIPDERPYPAFMLGDGFAPEVRQQILEDSRIPTYLAGDLHRSAVRLRELAEARQGRFRQGCAIPESSKAASVGAIVVACAAFESFVNELILLADLAGFVDEITPDGKLLGLVIGLSPERRLEAIAAIAGHLIDWGAQPYQDLGLLLSVRKHLLHHETRLVAPVTNYWPSKKLRAVAEKINSPYELDGEYPLPWYDHILTPAGAAWAVEVVASIAREMDLLRENLEIKLGLKSDNGTKSG